MGAWRERLDTDDELGRLIAEVKQTASDIRAERAAEEPEEQ